MPTAAFRGNRVSAVRRGIIPFGSSLAQPRPCQHGRGFASFVNDIPLAKEAAVTIRFILNGEDVEIHAEANQRLISILREHFGLGSAKSSCLHGSCGACSVFFNGALVSSGLIPAFRLQGSEIITLEGFAQQDEYLDIAAGFAETGVESCGYCDAGTILTAELLLESGLQPSRDEFTAAFRSIKCRCTDRESLFRGILAAGALRRRRIYGRP
jgi:carbon-monoxide dehydrogenase small subunit